MPAIECETAGLDLRIAERLLGYVVQTCEEECMSCTPGARWVPGGEYYVVDVPYLFWDPNSDDAEGISVPEYSTDEAYVLPLIERLFELNWQTNLVRMIDGWVVTLREFSPGMGSAQKAADTAPMALCSAVDSAGIDCRVH